MTQGPQIFLHDFGPKEVEQDIELCVEKEEEIGQDLEGDSGKGADLERKQGIIGVRDGLVGQNGKGI